MVRRSCTLHHARIPPSNSSRVCCSYLTRSIYRITALKLKYLNIGYIDANRSRPEDTDFESLKRATIPHYRHPDNVCRGPLILKPYCALEFSRGAVQTIISRSVSRVGSASEFNTLRISAPKNLDKSSRDEITESTTRRHIGEILYRRSACRSYCSMCRADGSGGGRTN